MSPSISKLSIVVLFAIVSLSQLIVLPMEAKLLGRQRIYDDSYNDGPYGGATGERAIITVRGARNPYNGYAPGKIAIEDEPFRGPYPRGVYDRLDSGYGRGIRSQYPHSDYGYGNSYNGGYGGYSGYNSGYNGGRYNSMFGAPSRIAVTGAFPY